MRFIRAIARPLMAVSAILGIAVTIAMLLAALIAGGLALAYVVGRAAIDGEPAASKAPIAYTVPTTVPAFNAEFQCPGTTYHGVRVDHWYIARIRDSSSRHRLIYALCFDGTSWSKYDAKRTREKIARLVTWVYHPTGGPVEDTTQVNFSALEFNVKYERTEK